MIFGRIESSSINFLNKLLSTVTIFSDSFSFVSNVKNFSLSKIVFMLLLKCDKTKGMLFVSDDFELKNKRLSNDFELVLNFSFFKLISLIFCVSPI